jgi:hypothetical protein
VKLCIQFWELHGITFPILIVAGLDLPKVGAERALDDESQLDGSALAQGEITEPRTIDSVPHFQEHFFCFKNCYWFGRNSQFSYRASSFAKSSSHAPSKKPCPRAQTLCNLAACIYQKPFTEFRLYNH